MELGKLPSGGEASVQGEEKKAMEAFCRDRRESLVRIAARVVNWPAAAHVESVRSCVVFVPGCGGGECNDRSE